MKPGLRGQTKSEKVEWRRWRKYGRTLGGGGEGFEVWRVLLEVVELVEVVEVLFGFYVKISPVMRQHFSCIVGVGWGQLCCDDWHLRQQQLLSRLSLIITSPTRMAPSQRRSQENLSFSSFSLPQAGEKTLLSLVAF